MPGVSQYSWNTTNVQGFSQIEVNGQKQVDTTEGLGAFKDLLELGLLKPYTKNLDIGGGEFDDGTRYLADHFIENAVYDPYMRPVYQNEQVLAEVESSPVDTVTSNSVLNVIDNLEARKEHILLAYSVLNPGGQALFKVWAGNETGQGSYTDGCFQSNQPAENYMGEVAEIFGLDNVELLADHKLVIAKK
ncbi:hypothetical protein [Spartinivicinus poritis]|uniref:Uncharacterized protein n=1 Tax=Spartinivicinus poritis TaxID=2994640 RepID=A0ABT5UCT8_9GAMM|nr:hypothetical protein [Spartinivicinus sp. A2-2]MDE1464025.1 hypothetical protein [Spartinivicinus sp. A2-2]